MSKPFLICIIDDDDIYRYTITRNLKALNISQKVLIFTDGEEAINFMIDNVGNSQNLPDIIFLDINMPIMDGFEFIEEYVKLKPRVGKKILIYMVSSSVNPVDIERAEAISEISDYLIKPIERNKLIGLIKSLEQEGKLG
ncbi:response regulator [Maribacter sp. 2210JD10-5]|uniref:response regulator n=1 Tax=Maribacter sp. 2210JD10-5 TaxID=3386272 RepID=UPI0039BC3105